MTIKEAMDVLNDYRKFNMMGAKADRDAFAMAIDALAKMEAIQKVIDMPFEWEQDDRRRYAKIVDIVRKDLYRRENNEK